MAFCEYSCSDFILEVSEGELISEAMHGFEFYPVAVKVQIEPQKTAYFPLC